MWIQLRTLRKSIRYAFKGMRTVVAHEQNFRIQLLVSALVIAAMFWFDVKTWEAVALILMMLLVLILEILNTVVERLIDVLQPRLHYYSEVIKDMMAAAVLLAAIGAVVVGSLIFYPHILPFFP